jgi:hypothetical protein
MEFRVVLTFATAFVSAFALPADAGRCVGRLTQEEYAACNARRAIERKVVEREVDGPRQSVTSGGITMDPSLAAKRLDSIRQHSLNIPDCESLYSKVWQGSPISTEEANFYNQCDNAVRSGVAKANARGGHEESPCTSRCSAEQGMCFAGCNNVASCIGYCGSAYSRCKNNCR